MNCAKRINCLKITLFKRENVFSLAKSDKARKAGREDIYAKFQHCMAM